MPATEPTPGACRAGSALVSPLLCSDWPSLGSTRRRQGRAGTLQNAVGKEWTLHRRHCPTTQASPSQKPFISRCLWKV